MAKAKVLHKRLKVDEAKKSHKCQHNNNHIIKRGDKRLKLTENRTDEHYCLECAARFLSGSIASLQGLLDEVNREMTAPALINTAPAVASDSLQIDLF